MPELPLRAKTLESGWLVSFFRKRGSAASVLGVIVEERLEKRHTWNLATPPHFQVMNFGCEALIRRLERDKPIGGEWRIAGNEKCGTETVRLADASFAAMKCLRGAVRWRERVSGRRFWSAGLEDRPVRFHLRESWT
ncbi:MAG: hypothetical protein R3C99_19290 [Pirellulaceae bacterium]